MPLRTTKFNPTYVNDTSGMVKQAGQFAMNAEIEASNAAKNLADNAHKLAKAYDIKEGKKEGHVRAVKEGLKWRPEQQGAMFQTTRAKARNEAGWEAFKSSVQIDMRSKVNELSEKYSHDEKGFDEAWNAYTSGLTDGITDENYLAEIGLLTQERGAAVRDTIRNNIGNAQEQASLEAIFANMSDVSEEAIEAAITGNQAGAVNSYDTNVIAIDNLVANGYITGAQAAERKTVLKNSINYSWHKGVVDGLIADGDIAGLQEYIKGVTAATGHGRRTLTSPLFADEAGNGSPFGSGNYPKTEISEDLRLKIGTYAQEALRNHNSQKAGINKDAKYRAQDLVKANNDFINAGKKPTDDEIQAMIDLANTSGDAKVIYDTNKTVFTHEFLNNGRTLNGDTGEYEKFSEVPYGDMSLTQQEAFLEVLRNNPNASNMKFVIDAAEKMHEAAKKADITYGVDRGWYDVTPLDYSDVGTLMEQLESRRLARQELKTKLGGDTDPSILTAAEQKQLIEYTKEDPAILGAFVQGLTGDEAMGFVERLGIEDPSVGIAAFYYQQGKNDVADELIAGWNASKMNPELNPDKKIYNESVFELIPGLYGASHAGQKQYDVVTQAIYSLYNARARANSVAPDEINEDILKSAVKDIVGTTISLSSEGEFGDIDYTIPSPNPAWTEDNAQDYTEQWLDALEVQDFVGVDPYVAGKLEEAGDALRIVPALDGNKGYFVYIPGTDNLVVKQDGEPFILTYDEGVFPVQEGDWYGTEVKRATGTDNTVLTEDEVQQYNASGSMPKPAADNMFGGFMAMNKNTAPTIEDIRAAGGEDTTKAMQDATQPNNTTVLPTDDAMTTSFNVVPGSADDLLIKSKETILDTIENADGTVTYVIENADAIANNVAEGIRDVILTGGPSGAAGLGGQTTTSGDVEIPDFKLPTGLEVVWDGAKWAIKKAGEAATSAVPVILGGIHEASDITSSFTDGLLDAITFGLTTKTPGREMRERIKKEGFSPEPGTLDHKVFEAIPTWMRPFFGLNYNEETGRFSIGKVSAVAKNAEIAGEVAGIIIGPSKFGKIVGTASKSIRTGKGAAKQTKLIEELNNVAQGVDKLSIPVTGAVSKIKPNKFKTIVEKMKDLGGKSIDFTADTAATYLAAEEMADGLFDKIGVEFESEEHREGAKYWFAGNYITGKAFGNGISMAAKLIGKKPNTIRDLIIGDLGVLTTIGVGTFDQWSGTATEYVEDMAQKIANYVSERDAFVEEATSYLPR